MSVLETRDLGIRFGGLQAAADINIAVSELEIVGVIGPNGAGKTTTFNMITGFYTPTTGRVLFKGQDITELPVHERARLGMGRTFQNVGLVKGSTVKENLLTAQHLEVTYGALSGMLGGPAARAEERRLKERADAVLELMGLTHLAESKIQGLPYGDLKRVEIATVLATDPEIILLDEPSSGMGPEESQELGDRLLRLREEMGLSILMIEHHVPLVTRVCDYVYCLSFGQLLAEGDPVAVRDDPRVVEAYLGSAAREQAEKEAQEAAASRAGTVA